jgi:hypothetical protein
MGLHYPPPFRKKCKVTGEWIVVTPEPVEYNEKSKLHALRARKKK